MLTLLALSVLRSAQTPDGQIHLPSGDTVSVSQYLRDQPAPPKLNPKLVEKALIKSFADLRAPVVFDLQDGYLDSNSPRSEIPSLPNDVSVLRTFTQLFNRRLDVADGAYVVHRQSVGSNDISSDGGEGQMFSWLSKFNQSNPSAFAKLVTGGADLFDLDPDGQAALRSFWSSQPGAAAGVVAGTPVTVRFDLFPRLLNAKGADASFGGTFRASNVAQPLPKRVPNAVPAATTPFVDQQDGDLDFGTGALLTVGNLAAKASSQFGFGFAVDSRFMQYPLFVKGRFTADRIALALRLIGTGGPNVVLSPPIGIRALRELKLNVLRASVRALQNSGDPRAAYLMQVLENPYGLDGQTLAQYGYTSDEIGKAVSVSVGLEFSISSYVQDRVDPATGQHFTLPVVIGEVLNGS